jgi:glutathione S-transferase
MTREGLPFIDEQRIAAALPKAEVSLFALSELMDEAPWLAGPVISLADLHAAPIISVIRLAPEGANLLNCESRLRECCERVSIRTSFLRTQVPPRRESHTVGTI